MKPLGPCWVPPIVTFYNQQGLLKAYSPPGSSYTNKSERRFAVKTVDKTGNQLALDQFAKLFFLISPNIYNIDNNFFILTLGLHHISKTVIVVAYLSEYYPSLPVAIYLPICPPIYQSCVFPMTDAYPYPHTVLPTPPSIGLTLHFPSISHP